jgi:hypothetical protein
MFTPSVEVAAMQILVVVRGAGVSSLGRVDAQVCSAKQPLDQLDQPASHRQQAQLGTREGKDVDSVELVVAGAPPNVQPATHPAAPKPA